MAGGMDRAVNPVSTSELERRWKAVSASMAEQDIDVLVMQGFNEYIGGYVKYFTDVPARNGYPDTVIFPRGGGMIAIRQGQDGSEIGSSELEGGSPECTRRRAQSDVAETNPANCWFQEPGA